MMMLWHAGPPLLAVFVTIATGVDSRADPVLVGVTFHQTMVHVDAETRVATPRGLVPQGLQAMAVSPSGTFYVATGRKLYTLDPWMDVTTYVADLDVPSAGVGVYTVRGLAFAPSGVLYASLGDPNSITYRLGTFDPGTGAYTEIGAFTGDRCGFQGLAFSPTGVLYGNGPVIGSESYFLATIDTQTAETSLLGEYAVPGEDPELSQSLAFTDSGRMFAVGWRGFAELDPSAGGIIGAVTQLDGDFRGLAVIPEPAVLWGLGLLTALLLRRQRG